ALDQLCSISGIVSLAFALDLDGATARQLGGLVRRGLYESAIDLVVDPLSLLSSTAQDGPVQAIGDRIGAGDNSDDGDDFVLVLGMERLAIGVGGEFLGELLGSQAWLAR